MKKVVIILCLVVASSTGWSLNEHDMFRAMFGSCIRTDENGVAQFDREALESFVSHVSMEFRGSTLLYCADLAQLCFKSAQDDSWKTVYARCRYTAAHSIWRDAGAGNLKGSAALHIARMWHDEEISYVLYGGSLEQVRQFDDVEFNARIAEAKQWPCALEQVQAENALNTLWPLLSPQGETCLREQLDAFGQELKNSEISLSEVVYRCCSKYYTANHRYTYTIFWLVEAAKRGNAEAYTFLRDVQASQGCPVNEKRWVGDGINQAWWRTEYNWVARELRPAEKKPKAIDMPTTDRRIDPWIGTAKEKED